MSDARPEQARLAQLLKAAGSALDVAAVEALIAGVLAAPAEIGGSWHALGVEPTPPELVAELEALKAAVAVGHSDGVQPEDFKRMPRAERLMLLREKLTEQGLAGFIVPRADEHQGEYVPLCGQRLAWLTGFTGSAGMAVVLAKRAAVFVDGRYTLQASAQVETEAYEIRHLVDQPAARWLAEMAAKGDIIGYDPWLHTPQEIERLRAGVEHAGATLKPVDENPLDQVWGGRPAAPLAPVFAQPETFAGENAADKRARIGKALSGEGAAAAVLTLPESIAWLLNIRGGDVSHTPLPLSFAIVKADGAVTLFIDRRKLTLGLDRHLGNGVTIEAPDRFGAALDALAKEGRVQVDPASAASWVFDRLGRAGAQIHRAADPCMLPKACKNTVELDGTREAHRRDGAAVIRFLAWLAGEAPKGGLREIAASDRLEAFRKEGKYFRDLSFPTISGAGSNGAIVHYRASLKGHIALATARFPKGTTGSQLDGFARRALWQVGLDYDHGTGHGVGSYLSVHEGPQRISKAANTQPLLPGMIVSNEPGYYKTGAYGIRIENLIVVQPDEEAAAEREMFWFETITLAPIDRNLVARDLLDHGEAAWLDAYHARVRATIGPLVDAETGAWLEEATAPIG